MSVCCTTSHRVYPAVKTMFYTFCFVLGTVTFCMCLCGSLEKRAWRHCIVVLLPPYLALSPMLVLVSILTRLWRNYMQVMLYHSVCCLHLTTFYFLTCTHLVFFPSRAQWPPTALLIWTSGIRSLCGSHWPVSVLPSGCGTTAHADCRSHRSHIWHHSGHHEGDRVWGGSHPWTLQRS